MRWMGRLAHTAAISSLRNERSSRVPTNAYSFSSCVSTWLLSWFDCCREDRKTFKGTVSGFSFCQEIENDNNTVLYKTRNRELSPFWTKSEKLIAHETCWYPKLNFLNKKSYFYFSFSARDKEISISWSNWMTFGLKLNVLTLSSSLLRSAGFGKLSVDSLRKQAFWIDIRCMVMFYANRQTGF